MSIYAGAVFGVGWLPTIVAGLQWRRMNRHAAFASMLGGVTTFVVVSELKRLEVVTMPGFIDPLIVALVVAIGGLIVVALITKPSAEEARYYALIESTSASKQTLETTLAGPRPLETLRREYRGIVATTLSLLVLSGLVWSYFALNLAF
jgi:sodium/pantothenate symporter